MKKFLAIVIYFTFFANSAFADIGDVLYAKNSPSLVREKPYVDSTIIAELKTGYVVLDKGTVSSRWTKILLTDGKIGYIYNFNIGKNAGSKYEIKGNYGVLDKTAFIKQLPSDKSKLIGILNEKDNFEIMHLNYIYGTWAKIKVLDGKNKGKIGYINKDKIKLYCNFENGYNVINSTFNSTNIPDTSYCSRFKINKNNQGTSEVTSSTNNSDTIIDTSLEDFLNNLGDILDK